MTSRHPADRGEILSSGKCCGSIDFPATLRRMREWRDVHAQLKELVSEIGWKVGELMADPVNAYANIHRALLTGLLGNAGFKTEENYLGARGIKFWIHPGSGVAKKAGR